MNQDYNPSNKNIFKCEKSYACQNVFIEISNIHGCCISIHLKLTKKIVSFSGLYSCIAFLYLSQNNDLAYVTTNRKRNLLSKICPVNFGVTSNTVWREFLFIIFNRGYIETISKLDRLFWFIGAKANPVDNYNIYMWFIYWHIQHFYGFCILHLIHIIFHYDWFF